MNAITAGLLAGAMLSLGTATWAASPPSMLRVQINADIRSTDPGVNRDDNSDTVVLHMVEGLVGMREDTSIGPMLATRVDVSDDGLTYTFPLRQGVRFHNGATLTADDVVWTWKRYLAPETGWRCLPEFDGHGAAKIVDVQATDPQTVTFRIDQPSALFLRNMVRADCGGSGIYHRASLGDDGKWKLPIGTGPFKFAEWKRGQQLDLAAFTEYTSLPGERDGFVGGKKAEVDVVRFLVIPDSSAAKTGLYSGAIDIYASASSQDMAELVKRKDVASQSWPSMNVVGMLFQTTDPLLKDVRMRRAIAVALDYDAIAAAVTEGSAPANNSIIPSRSPYHSAVAKQGYTRDLAQAKRLLSEAGYQGQPISLIANKRYEATYNAAVIIQALALEAGINLQIEVLDWATQLDRYTKGQYQAMVFPYSSRLDPSLSFDMIAGPKAKQPRKVWDNPAMQDKLLQSMKISDQAARQALFDTLHTAMIADVPMVALFNGVDAAGVGKHVKGYQTWAADKPRFWNVRKD